MTSGAGGLERDPEVRFTGKCDLRVAGTRDSLRLRLPDLGMVPSVSQNPYLNSAFKNISSLVQSACFEGQSMQLGPQLGYLVRTCTSHGPSGRRGFVVLWLLRLSNTSKALVLTIWGYTFSQSSTTTSRKPWGISHFVRGLPGYEILPGATHFINLSAQLNPGIHLLIQQIFVERLRVRLIAMKKNKVPTLVEVVFQESENEFI